MKTFDRTNARVAATALALSTGLQLASAQPGLPTAAREQLNGVAWVQHAVEYQGNALQTYRLAESLLPAVKAKNSVTASVEQASQGGFKSKKKAVVLDVDETTLDNMPFNAMLVREGKDWNKPDWAAWVQASKAKPVPGVVKFIARARLLGFRPVFITNRACNKDAGYDAQGKPKDCALRKPTIDNLANVLGYRPEDEDVLMQYDKESRNDDDKQERRAQVARTYRIAMLIGDDLNDFIRGADYKEDDHAGRWGTQWFALPNPVYGSWDKPFRALEQKYAALDVWTAPAGPSAGPVSLNIVTWNMAWLADPAVLDSKDFWNKCAAKNFDGTKLAEDLPFCNAYGKEKFKTAADYADQKLAPMRARLAELAGQKVDVLGVVETQSAAALQAVLPPGYKVECFTTRPDPQNLGFAVREAANLTVSCREIRPLSLEDVPNISHPVRRGLELTVSTGGKTLTLLNVHLKASCAAGKMDGPKEDCRLLQMQAQPLEAWIEEQANAGRDFMIIGDWNRDLEAEVNGRFAARTDGSDPTTPIPSPTVVRNLWPEINDKMPPASAMELAVMDRTATSGGCFGPLDQVATSVRLLQALDPASLTSGRQPAALLSRPGVSSDHCPVQIKLKWR